MTVRNRWGLRRRWVVCVAALAAAAGVMVAGAGRSGADAPRAGQVVGGPVRALTETWDQIRQREARRRATRNTKATPLPLVTPWLSRGLRGAGGAPGDRAEAAFTPPGSTAAMALAASFPGLDLEEEFRSYGRGFIPPDTNGAIGPRHFMEILNGGIRVYSRDGLVLAQVRLDAFFSFAAEGVSYPRAHMFDPHVLYDRRSRRWLACALEFASGDENHCLLAVSRTDDPLGAWDKYLLRVGIPRTAERTIFTDYPTLAVDDNGIYIGFNMFGVPVDPQSSDLKVTARLAVIRKAPLLSAVPYLEALHVFDAEGVFTPSAATNFDAAGPTDPAWILSSVLELEAGNQLPGGKVRLQKLTWAGRAPLLHEGALLPTAPHAFSPPAPTVDAAIPLETGDDRFTSVLLRGGRLWAARDVGVNAAGESVVRPDGSSEADRGGCEWLEIDVTGPAPAVVQTGRVWDPAEMDPRSYFFPSIAVNGQGHAVMGFSGCTAAEFPGAYFCSRLASDPPGTMGAVRLMKSGEASYMFVSGTGRNRWGDYSKTTVDPNDDMSIWTIQEYSKLLRAVPVPGLSPSRWGTWIGQVVAPPPTLTHPAGSGTPGQPVELVLTGTGFYDPGSGFPNRLRAQLPGGAVNGIVGLAVQEVAPTRVALRFTLARDASPGTRDLVLANPDGQTVVAREAFTVLPPPEGLLEVPRRVRFGTVRVRADRTRTLVIRNASETETLAVTVHAPTAPFSLTAGAGPALLQPGATHPVTLSVRAERAGRVSGRLRIDSSDPASQSVVVRLEAAAVPR